MNDETPVPIMQCGNCGGTIWRQGNWFQCPDCGALSTQYGGLFTGNAPVPDFVDAVNKVRTTEQTP